MGIRYTPLATTYLLVCTMGHVSNEIRVNLSVRFLKMLVLGKNAQYECLHMLTWLKHYFKKLGTFQLKRKDICTTSVLKIYIYTYKKPTSIAFSEVKKYCNRTRCGKGACHTKMQAEKKFIFCVQ